VDILALGVGLAGEFGLNAESVGTEVITLGLEKVGGKILGSVSVVERKSRAEGGSRNAPESALGDNTVKD
jgi:hypothetical protein